MLVYHFYTIGYVIALIGLQGIKKLKFKKGN